MKITEGKLEQMIEDTDPRIAKGQANLVINALKKVLPQALVIDDDGRVPVYGLGTFVRRTEGGNPSKAPGQEPAIGDDGQPILTPERLGCIFQPSDVLEEAMNDYAGSLPEEE